MITLMDVLYHEEEVDTPSTVECDIDLPEIQKSVYISIKNNEGLRTPQLMKLTGYSTYSVKRALKELTGKELIIYKGSSRDGGYFIK